uniref:Solute carrier family 35 member F6 n=1 Tax=Acrobeloides nanus TaxID=290746 RepID=A0A914CJR7_9BILA
MSSVSAGAVAFNLFITVLMVVTGSINTLAGKFTDHTIVNNKHFKHPFFQAAIMFSGQLLCLFVYLIMKKLEQRRQQNRESENSGAETPISEILDIPKKTPPQINNWVFLPLSCCDATSSAISYVALILTNASSYQMLRGSVIIFTGLVSTAFLGMKLKGYQWLGMFLVTLGLVVIGLTDYIYGDKVNDDINGIITGDLLIIISQLIVSFHVSAQQKFLKQYDVPPLKAVGMEGMFGLMVVSFAMIPMYFIHVSPTFSNNPQGRLEDVITAFKEIAVSTRLQITITITVFSMAFFNFAGLTVTKRLSATSRMVLDSIRTLVIWMISIPLFGQ